MKNCPKCAEQLADDTIICPNCGHEMAPQVETPAAPNAPAAKAGDKASVGLCILAVLIPIFGVIYWAIKRKECPKRANACGIAGLASWIFNFIVIMAQML